MRSYSKEEIQKMIFSVMKKKFGIDNPDPAADLRDAYNFDSIDAIELLVSIEEFLKSQLTQDEKQNAMEIRNINQICDYIQTLIKARP